jgi:hypothetical protein
MVAIIFGGLALESARFELLRVVVMKIQVFWDVMPCEPISSCPENVGITLLQSAGNCLPVDLA